MSSRTLGATSRSSREKAPRNGKILGIGGIRACPSLISPHIHVGPNGTALTRTPFTRAPARRNPTEPAGEVTRRTAAKNSSRQVPDKSGQTAETTATNTHVQDVFTTPPACERPRAEPTACTVAGTTVQAISKEGITESLLVYGVRDGSSASGSRDRGSASRELAINDKGTTPYSKANHVNRHSSIERKLSMTECTVGAYRNMSSYIKKKSRSYRLSEG